MNLTIEEMTMSRRKPLHQRFAILVFLVAWISVLAILVWEHAQAQTVPGTATLSWELPTTSVEGLPLTGPHALTAVHVHLSTQPIPADYDGEPTLTLPGSSSGAVYTMQVPNGSRLFARVRACNKGACSAWSEQASKWIEVDTTPDVPAGVTIEIAVEL